MTIGARIRERRQQLELTQTKLADLVEDRRTDDHRGRLQQADISHWERGTVPSSPMLIPLADALDVSVRWLLSGQERPAASPADGPLEAAGSGA